MSLLVVMRIQLDIFLCTHAAWFLAAMRHLVAKAVISNEYIENMTF